MSKFGNKQDSHSETEQLLMIKGVNRIHGASSVIEKCRWGIILYYRFSFQIKVR